MKLLDIKLVTLQPIALSVLWEGGSAELIEAHEGEAFLRIGTLPVERYTLVMNGENPADLGSLYKAIAEYEHKQILVPAEDTLMGFAPMEFDLMGVLPSVADYEGNRRIPMVTFEHSYKAKTFMPSLRKELLVTWEQSKQEDTNMPGYAFAQLMDTIRQYGERYNCQFMVRLTDNNIMITAAYEGTRDNRHLELNKEIDLVLGQRNG
jgi:hypothetical protein